IPPAVAGIFFQVCYYIYANILYYYRKTTYVMYVSLTAMVLNLILNSIFIPKFGYVAAGYTTLVSYLVQAALDYFAMKKVTGEKVYNMKVIGLISFIVILVAFLSNAVYQNIFIRYVLLLIIIIS